DGARVNLLRDPDGRGNWQDFGASSERAPNEPPADGLADNLDIERIEIRDSEVRWYDESSAPRYVLRGITLTTGRVRADEPIDAALAVDVEDTATARRFAVETRSQVGVAALRAAAADATVSLRGFALRLRAYDPTGAEIAAASLDAERFD